MMLSRPKLFKLLLLDPMCRQTNRSNGNVDLMWKLQIHHCCLENQPCWHYQHSSPVMSFQAGAWFKSESRHVFRFGSFLMKLLNSLIVECWKCMLIWSKEFVHRELSCSNIISQWTLVARWRLGFWQLTIVRWTREDVIYLQFYIIHCLLIYAGKGRKPNDKQEFFRNVRKNNNTWNKTKMFASNVTAASVYCLVCTACSFLGTVTCCDWHIL